MNSIIKSQKSASKRGVADGKDTYFCPEIAAGPTEAFIGGKDRRKAEVDAL